LIRKLQFNLEDASRYRPSHIDMPKHTVMNDVRLMDAPVKEVIFENNPALVQQIDMLSIEKKKQDRDIDKARLDIKDREDECARLRGLVDKLRKGADDFKADFGNSSLPDQKSMRKYYIDLRKDMIERIIDMRNRAKEKVVQELSLRLIQMNKDMAKQKRYYEEKNSQKLVSVSKTTPRDPLYVWTQLRLRVVHWLFEVFVRSRDESTKYKK
jgi:hypothetical protein